MDYFERHFALIKKSEKIFKQHKMDPQIEIAGLPDIEEVYEKTGQDLLNKDIIEQFLSMRSVPHYKIVVKKLIDFTLSEWITCLNEKVLLEYSIPVLYKALSHYPMLYGTNDEWQVLFEITKVEESFWKTYRGLKKPFVAIIDKVLYENAKENFYSSIKQEYLESMKDFVK